MILLGSELVCRLSQSDSDEGSIGQSVGFPARDSSAVFAETRNSTWILFVPLARPDLSVKAEGVGNK